MSTKTFDEALEAAYAEAWRLDENCRKSVAQPEAAGWNKDVAVNNQLQKFGGGRAILGALLHLDGQIGLRAFPSAYTPVVPDPHQAQVKLLEWAVGRGLIKQSEMDSRITGQMEQVIGRIGDDFL